MLKNDYSRAGIALTIMWCASLLAQFITEIVLHWFMPQLYTSSSYYWIMYIISVYIVSTPVFVLVCGGRGILRPYEKKRKITVKDFARLAVICIALTYVFNFVGVMVNERLSRIVGHNIVNPLTELESTNQFMQFLCTCLISPFIEELVFRGVLLKKLRPYGDKLAVWFSAIAFGLYHGNFSQFFYAAVLGLVFGGIAVKTNRLVYTMLLHVVVNVCGSLIIPGIFEVEHMLVTAIGVVLLFIVIIYGIVLAAKMLPHLKINDTLNMRDVREAAVNPGVIGFVIFSGLMFAMAIFV